MNKEIETRPFGKMQIDEKQILHFPEGLLGFEQYTNFALVEENEETPFKWLQSLDDKDLAFIVIQPVFFVQNYKPVLDKEELSQIEIEDLNETLLMVIVTIPENPELMTANLQGPILINPKNKIAKQFISRDETHPVRKLILETSSEKK
jgi:flagellar assembly factor FliW